MTQDGTKSSDTSAHLPVQQLVQQGAAHLGGRRMTLEQRYQQVVARVRAAEQRFSRETGSVQVLPVSKARPAADIARLADLGVHAFGESYLQEAQAKIAALAGRQLEWHFIGPIQANKTQAIARHFAWVHSVDREKIARRLSEQRPAELPPLNICLQLNISGEATKSGVTPAQLPALIEQVLALPRLRLRGLMAIPAPGEDVAQQRAAFRQVREAFEHMVASGIALDTLSMGMSADLEAAIAEGSTLVRVGTDIFGSRA